MCSSVNVNVSMHGAFCKQVVHACWSTVLSSGRFGQPLAEWRSWSKLWTQVVCYSFDTCRLTVHPSCDFVWEATVHLFDTEWQHLTFSIMSVVSISGVMIGDFLVRIGPSRRHTAISMHRPGRTSACSTAVQERYMNKEGFAEQAGRLWDGFGRESSDFMCGMSRDCKSLVASTSTSHGSLLWFDDDKLKCRFTPDIINAFQEGLAGLWNHLLLNTMVETWDCGV